MTCDELTLEGPREIRFGDGSIAQLSYRKTEERGCAYLVFHNGSRLTLAGVVDDGQTVSTPRVFVAHGLLPDRVAFFGGTTLVIVSSAGHLLATHALHRDLTTDEYWSTQTLVVGDMLLIIYGSS